MKKIILTVIVGLIGLSVNAQKVWIKTTEVESGKVKVYNSIKSYTRGRVCEVLQVNTITRECIIAKPRLLGKNIGYNVILPDSVNIAVGDSVLISNKRRLMVEREWNDFETMEEFNNKIKKYI